jgi:formylglycine-generating enzyme required for sulfatase activity
MMFLPPYTWGQDGMANNMANITAGEYRPLYLSLDSPLVSVQSFKIDTQPVTNRQFQYFLLQNPKWQRDVVPTLFAENNYLSHWEKSSNLYQPNLSDLDKPVIFVSWYAAQAYCHAQQKRLPTVAEWEYVAQASFIQKDGSQEKDYNQKILDWYAKAAKEPSKEVGKDQPNYWGVHNMHGLIWEWTEDFNSNLISGESRDDSSVNKDLYCASGSAGAVNPSDYAAFMRYGFRSSLNAKFTLSSLGFRCAADDNR